MDKKPIEVAKNGTSTDEHGWVGPLKSALKNHSWELGLCVCAILGIHLFLLSKAYRGAGFGSEIDAMTAGQFGDFIGGYLGTIFLVISVALLAASYRNQNATARKTAFETRFFELLRYHQANTAEFDLGNREGRAVFISLIAEFRGCLEIVRAAFQKLNRKPESQEDEIASI